MAEACQLILFHPKYPHAIFFENSVNDKYNQPGGLFKPLNVGLVVKLLIGKVFIISILFYVQGSLSYLYSQYILQVDIYYFIMFNR